MFRIKKYTGLLLSTALLFSVHSFAKKSQSRSFVKKPQASMHTTSLHPDAVLQKLKDGNKRFYSGKTKKHLPLLTLAKRSSIEGQSPQAVILACMDSRSIPEIVFDQTIADIFTLRVAGNVVDTDILASLEYATKHVGSKVIVIMGHTQCGAVEAACKGGATGNLVSLIHQINPAVEIVKKSSPDKKLDCADESTITQIAMQNVLNMVAKVEKESPVIRELIVQGKVKIVGALHNLKTGVVTFFEKQD